MVTPARSRDAHACPAITLCYKLYPFRLMPEAESSYTGFHSINPNMASRKRITMNSASTHHTATKAGRKARSASRVVLACALVQALVLGLGAASSAYAQQHDRHDDPA